MHSFAPDYSLSQPAKLDAYAHDPEPPQDPVQIGDGVEVKRGPHRGLLGRIAWINHPILWVYPFVSDDADSLEYETLLPEAALVRVDHAEIKAPVTLKFSKQNGYDVTVGDLVQVVRGKYWNTTGVVLSVDFRNAMMDIRCSDNSIVRV